MLKQLIGYALRTLFLYSGLTCAADDVLIIHAARLFDGYALKTNTSVLIENGKIAKVAPRDSFKANTAKTLDLGDATLLPALIDLHAHTAYQHIPNDTILQHGIGTVRDTGGNVHPPKGGDGQLRVLSSGLIITAANGYPIPNMGADNLAIAVSNEAQARQAVQDMIAGGAVAIKIALETGGEHGAPWTLHHHAPHAMPLLSENIVKAIVNEAHQHGRKVTAHLAESKGVSIALNAGVDEWAHTPCNSIPAALLKRAVQQQVTIISTLDTLSKCEGVAKNVHDFVKFGGTLLYGAEIAHPDIPWGIDAQELNLMMHYAHLSPLDVLQRATALSGNYLNLAIGKIQQGAIADLIAVNGDVTKNFKPLEYPKFVMSGGKIMLYHFLLFNL